ncbi:hypothetical protein [Actinoplanes derwentensis]|uniref:hypothetical protein n=1 Tax=Actinoplanes derwentensis TaxID=113562 RepID=UPI0012FD9C2F|nr:hypothetical protein [Actinoplanes derwentensis]
MSEEQRWRDWFTARSGAVPGWTPWTVVPWPPRTDGDEPGNPVLSARSPDSHRALRVIRHAPAPSDPGVVLASWVTRYPEEFSDLPREELVVSLVESPPAIEQAARLVEAWLRAADAAELQVINPAHEP